jgi:hypothetical protein
MRFSLKPRQDGQILAALIITIPFLLLMIAAYLTLSTSNLRVARQDQLHTHAQIGADAGADYAVEQINQDASWNGTNGEVTLHNDGAIKSTYAVSVTVNSSTSKTLTVTGKAYWPTNRATPNASVKINVGLQAISSGNYSVASGEGGLIMLNSSKIAGGNVLVNGAVSISNTAQIGLSTNPVTVQIADAVCPVPPDATYPRVCTVADGQPQPISMSNTAWIYGSVKANNQTSGAQMSNPGLVASSGVATQSLPTYDRAAQKAAVTTTITGSAASCSGTSQTWAANTKIVGDVTINNKCVVTIAGNIWITGSLTLKNSAQILVADSLGSTRPIIMVDGASGVTLNNSAKLASNSSGTGLELISFYSTAACSPDCTSLSGTDLNNSRNITTINLQQSATGPQTVFYAYWTKVEIGNSGQLGSLIGQTVQLENTGTITFTTSTGTGVTAWIISSYQRSY